MTKTLLILFLFAKSMLFAQNSSDIAVTATENYFHGDALNYLRKHKVFYGIRYGTYQSNGYGFQLGYEQAQAVNCKGLDLKRVYANALYMPHVKGKIHPYGLVTLGYEKSNIKRFLPSQLFIGAGAGLRASITPAVNAFVEAAVHLKPKSSDTDVITTIGLAYVLNLSGYRTENTSAATAPELTAEPVVVTETLDAHSAESYPELEVTAHKSHKKPKHKALTGKHYYIQIAALAKTRPAPYLRKLRKRGFRHIRVKHAQLRGRKMIYVVVGPYRSRAAAARVLRKVRKIYSDAFIRKF